MKNYQDLTWQAIKERFDQTEQLIKETSQQMKETDRQMKENDLRLTKMREETDRQMKENDLRLTKMREETDRLMKENSREIKELNRSLGGISNSNGDMAEEFFFNIFRRNKTFVNEHYDSVQKNYFYSNGEAGAESDIVLFNGTSVAIIEVKYKATQKNIRIEKLISNVTLFKKCSPIYRNHKVYLGVAAMSFGKWLEQELHDAGIATIHPLGKKIVIYDKDVREF
jgi:hypothetical protein